MRHANLTGLAVAAAATVAMVSASAAWGSAASAPGPSGSAVSASAASAPGPSGPPPGCGYAPATGGYMETCGSTTSVAGSTGTSGGTGSGAVMMTCTVTPVSAGWAASLNLPWPPPRGFSYGFLLCDPVHPGYGTGPSEIILVGTATGRPPISPVQLLQAAVNELTIPGLAPATAPPRGSAGLVGLPEWFWIPAAQWRPVSAHVAAGPVWLTLTATPVSLTVTPGPGLGPVTCRGPGTAYNPSVPAAGQHSDCTYTYEQPSSTQPGGTFHASVTVRWAVTWTGSGGTAGVVAGGLSVTVPVAVPVDQAEALVIRP